MAGVPGGVQRGVSCGGDGWRGGGDGDRCARWIDGLM